jgi:hypothetical protein
LEEKRVYIDKFADMKRDEEIASQWSVYVKAKYTDCKSCYECRFYHGGCCAHWDGMEVEPDHWCEDASKRRTE